MVKEEKFAERARVIQEKGTNRLQVLTGQTGKYTWLILEIALFLANYTRLSCIHSLSKRIT